MSNSLQPPQGRRWGTRVDIPYNSAAAAGQALPGETAPAEPRVVAWGFRVSGTSHSLLSLTAGPSSKLTHQASTPITENSDTKPCSRTRVHVTCFPQQLCRCVC